ncbi:MAG: O-antigen ligase family protein [Deltaproteobacteria bacterium]|jgi:hypothetical protein|nr:O-antigen ligase family protein [Deltaproteobacteria bacterium]
MSLLKNKGVLLAILIVFIMLDSFFLLPDNIVVPVPGFFRISDILIIIVMFTFILFPNRIITIFQEYTQLSLIVICACILFIITVIMANIFFHQPFFNGLLFLRDNFIYLLFFTFLVLINSEEKLRVFIKLSVILITCVALLAIIQKCFPQSPIFNYRFIGEEQYSDIRHLRLGDYRLFFPHMSFTFLFYFIMLADLLHTGFDKKCLFKLFFVILIIFSVISTATRVHVITMTIITTVAFLTSRKKIYKIAGIVLLIIGISIQAFSLAVSKKGIAALEENKLVQIILSAKNVSQGSIEGRLFQHDMYMKNFLKSPVLGVGTLRFDPNYSNVYKKHKFYYNNDLGYSKMLAEYGLVGIAWLSWLYIYIFKKTRKISKVSFQGNDIPYPIMISKGVWLFFLYIAISSLTLPHFIEGYRIVPIVLSLVFLVIANNSIESKGNIDNVGFSNPK